MIAQTANVTGGVQTSYLNLVPEVGKLTIIPVLDFEPFPVPIGPAYGAMFNPENWQVQTNLEYCDQSKDGSVGSILGFKKIGSSTLSFDLVVDGTGASGEKREVLKIGRASCRERV